MHHGSGLQESLVSMKRKISKLVMRQQLTNLFNKNCVKYLFHLLLVT
jgi:hypothetical protein